MRRLDTAQGQVQEQSRQSADAAQFACVQNDGADSAYVPLHGFTAVDLGYSQGNAVSKEIYDTQVSGGAAKFEQIDRVNLKERVETG